MGKFFPVIIVAEEFAGDVSRAFAGEEGGQLELFFERYSAGHADLARFFDFLPAGALFPRCQDFVGHVGIGTAGREAVSLDVMFGVFGGDGFDEADDGGFGGGIGREVGSGREGAAATDDNDFPGAPLHHFGKDRSTGMHDAEDISFESLAPGPGIGIVHEADGPLHAGGGDQNVGAAEAGAHPFGGHNHAVEFADITREAEGDTAGVLDFEMGEIDFGFGAGDEADGGTYGGETDGEAFPDSATGPGDENAFSLQVRALPEGIITNPAREATLRGGFSMTFDGVHGFVGATEESGGVFFGAMFDDPDGSADRDGDVAAVEGNFVAAFETLENLGTAA